MDPSNSLDEMDSTLKDARSTLTNLTNVLRTLADWQEHCEDLMPILTKMDEKLKNTTEVLSKYKVDTNKIRELEDKVEEQKEQLDQYRARVSRRDEQIHQLQESLVRRSPPPAQRQRYDPTQESDMDMSLLPEPNARQTMSQDEDHAMEDLMFNGQYPTPDSGRRTRETTFETQPETQFETPSQRGVKRNRREESVIPARYTQPVTNNPSRRISVEELDKLPVMFHFEGEWSDALKECFKTKLRDACVRKPSFEEAVRMIDKHCYGKLDGHPPDPRPCLIAEIKSSGKGPGGQDHSFKACPHCKGAAGMVCCHGKFVLGVQASFGIRNANGVVPQNARKHVMPRAETMTVPMADGKAARWSVWLHKAK